MRPRPIPRKTSRDRTCSSYPRASFNEAAADTAENGGPSPADLVDHPGFNEAAADTAENGRGRGRARHARHRASMRPRPIPRKTSDPGGRPGRIAVRFNEAAADTAENGGLAVAVGARPRRFNEAAADTAENGRSR